MSLHIVQHPVLSSLSLAIVMHRSGKRSHVYYHNDGQFHPLGGSRCPKAFGSTKDAVRVALTLGEDDVETT